MGAPQVPSGSVKPRAEAAAKTRELRGELVHLTGASGRVRVKRAGSFEWESVGSGGLTVNADDQIAVPRGGRVTITSKLQGTKTISGAKGAILSQASHKPRPKTRNSLPVSGLIRQGR